MRVRVPYEKRVRAKGKLYYYHAKTGHRLDDDPQVRARQLFYINATLKRTTPGRGVGTIAHTRALYLASPGYKQLAASSRRSYRYHTDLLCELWGDQRVDRPQRRHLLALRDHFSDTPA